MKKLQLMITPELMAQLGLTDASDDAAVVMAIKKTAEQAAKVPQLQSSIDLLKTENSTLKEDKEKAEAAVVEKDVDTQLENALKEGRTTVELNATLKNDYKANPTGLKTVLAALKQYQPITDKIENGDKKAKYDGKTYDELHNSGELEDVRANYPETYKAVFKEKFGKDPK